MIARRARKGFSPQARGAELGSQGGGGGGGGGGAVRSRRALRTAGRAHRDDDSSDEEDASKADHRSQRLSFIFLVIIVLPVVLLGGSWLLGLLGLGGASDAAQYRTALTDFYRQVDRSKLKNVNDLLDKYQGQEKVLFRKLKKKYGLSPMDLMRRQREDGD